jgi:hypothetical protein
MSRAKVIELASYEIGPDTQEKRVRYWSDALGRPMTYAEIEKPAWCGIFALYCLHQAGLDTDEHWKIGAGFLLQNPHPMHLTTEPQAGDIGYIASPFQHHFIVESTDNLRVHSIDGNQPDIRRQSRVMSAKIAYYSIASLLAAAGQPDELPAPSVHPIAWTQPATVQHALNTLILARPDAAPPALLTVDGVIGPKSTDALLWAQALLAIPVTGLPDDTTCRALGLA